MNNPWEASNGTYCDAQSRLDRVKRMTVPQLVAAIDWPDTQKTVRIAAARRLRKLTGVTP